jgi:DNA-binding response OmpR family regulator
VVHSRPTRGYSRICKAEAPMARILVVEDDEDVRALVTRRLEHTGHQVLAAGDADEALRLIDHRGAPDLVVLDVNMPRVTGFELLGQIREQVDVSDLPAIFLTGQMRSDDIATGRGLGAVYLTKPLMASALTNAVQALLLARAEIKPASATTW